jgi:hypothetical protein
MTEQARRRCEQCGREGVRGFRRLGGFDTPHGYAPPLTVCANGNACRKRWPKQPEPSD